MLGTLIGTGRAACWLSSAAVLAALVTGCGGSGSSAASDPEAEIESVVTSFSVALSENDPAACNYLTGSAARFGFCQEPGRGFDNDTSDSLMQHLRFAQVRAVVVRGREAAAKLRIGSETMTVLLTKDASGWLIAQGVPGQKAMEKAVEYRAACIVEGCPNR